jgi:hypothetical protein
MATPPLASVSKTDSDADLAALVTAANDAFIDQAATAIAEATAQGKFEVFLYTVDPCDLSFLSQYFFNLGYAVAFPDFVAAQGSQPAQLFGPDFAAYFNNQLLPFNTQPKNPTRMGLSWRVPSA